jgi:hypothetical protein
LSIHIRGFTQPVPKGVSRSRRKQMNPLVRIPVDVNKDSGDVNEDSGDVNI